MQWSRAVGAVVWCAVMTACGGEEAPAVVLPGDSGPEMPDGGDPDAEAPDAPDATPDAAPARCPIVWDAPAAPLGAGTRMRVTADPDADLSATGEAGFAVYPAEDRGAWWVRVPYVVGATDVVVEARCADGGVEAHRRPITVRPLTWTATASWSEGIDGPPGREYFAMWLDPVDRDRLWVYGGFHYRPAQFTPSQDLWVRDLATDAWAAVEQDPPGPRVGGAALLPLPETRAALHIGGLAVEDGATALGVGLRRLDYEAPVATWSEIAFARPVFGDYQPAVLLDGDRLIAIGGQGRQGPHLDGTWYALDGSDRGLLRLADGARPPGRTGFAWAALDGRLAVFSGEQGGAGGPACDCADDTWLMDLDAEGRARWTRFEHPDQPPARRNAVFGVDPDARRLFVWGGTADGRTSVPGLSALHFDRGGEAWVDVPVAAGPDGEAPVRSSGRAVHDPNRGRMLFGFGNGDDGVRTDLWALEL